MNHERCAQCRNPIRGRQAAVPLPRAAMTFHSDCWGELHQTVQTSYLESVREGGVAALLIPYQRSQMASWLPQAAIEDAVVALSEQLDQHLAAGPLAGHLAAADAVAEQPAPPGTA